MSENKALIAKVKALEAKIKALEAKVDPKPVKVDGTIVLCTWAGAPEGSQFKCAWTGRTDKYQAHLDQFHKGEDYKAPKTGIRV